MSEYASILERSTGRPLGGLLEDAARRWPHAKAAAFPGESLTYSQLWNWSLGVGAWLRAQGVVPGENVGLLIPNSGAALAGLFGAALMGAIPVPLNTRYRGEELPYVVEHADLVAMLTTSSVAVNNAGETIDYPQRLREAFPDVKVSGQSPAKAPKLRFVAGFGIPIHGWVHELPECPADTDAIDTPSWVAAPEWEDAAVLLYTSGTTSRPKGVVISHRALVGTCVRGAVGRIGLGRDDAMWNPAPLCHISAFVAIVGCIATGAHYLSEPFFDPATTLAQLARESVTIAYANFPAFYVSLAEQCNQTGVRLQSLRVLTTAAAPAEIARIRADFPEAFQLSVTGATELSGSICVSAYDDSEEARATTSGHPVDDVELAIRDAETRAPVPTGSIGELWVRGICLLTRYYRDPRPPLTDDGWFRTGDLGSLDEAGRLTFRGRIKDMLKVGGENVSAAEVESYLLGHPAIAVAQVVAAPDLRLGEIPVAFVELAGGQSVDAESVIEFCRSGMARFKVPREIRFVTEWPMSATKIQKDKLRERLAERAVP